MQRTRNRQYRRGTTTRATLSACPPLSAAARHPGGSAPFREKPTSGIDKRTNVEDELRERPQRSAHLLARGADLARREEEACVCRPSPRSVVSARVSRQRSRGTHQRCLRRAARRQTTSGSWRSRLFVRASSQHQAVNAREREREKGRKHDARDAHVQSRLIPGLVKLISHTLPVSNCRPWTPRSAFAAWRTAS